MTSYVFALLSTVAVMSFGHPGNDLLVTYIVGWTEEMFLRRSLHSEMVGLLIRIASYVADEKPDLVDDPTLKNFATVVFFSLFRLPRFALANICKGRWNERFGSFCRILLDEHNRDNGHPVASRISSESKVFHLIDQHNPGWTLLDIILAGYGQGDDTDSLIAASLLSPTTWKDGLTELYAKMAERNISVDQLMPRVFSRIRMLDPRDDHGWALLEEILMRREAGTSSYPYLDSFSDRLFPLSLHRSRHVRYPHRVVRCLVSGGYDPQVESIVPASEICDWMRISDEHPIRLFHAIVALTSVSMLPRLRRGDRDYLPVELIRRLFDLFKRQRDRRIGLEQWACLSCKHLIIEHSLYESLRCCAFVCVITTRA